MYHAQAPQVVLAQRERVPVVDSPHVLARARHYMTELAGVVAAAAAAAAPRNRYRDAA